MQEWRRGRDSNPRMGFTPINGLANPGQPTAAESGNAVKARTSNVSTSRLERRQRRLDYLASARESAQYDPRSGKPIKSLEELLSRHAVAPSGCWEWTGTINRHGYGVICLMLDGKPNTMPAHRLQWMRVRGRIPEGQDCCHTCDNRRCINPDHLFLGTPKDNIHDMIRKGRANFGGLKFSGESAQESAQRTARLARSPRP